MYDAGVLYANAKALHELLQESRAENAKLRELVRAIWLYDYAGRFSSKREDMEHVAMVHQRMRELGIEVDE